MRPACVRAPAEDRGREAYEKTSGYSFHNRSGIVFERLKDEPANIATNLWSVAPEILFVRGLVDIRNDSGMVCMAGKRYRDLEKRCPSPMSRRALRWR